MLPILYSNPAKQYLKKIVEKPLKIAYLNAITEIRSDPSIGDPKTGDLSGIYSYDIRYKGNNYELTYRLEETEESKIRFLTRIGSFLSLPSTENSPEVIRAYCAV